VDLPVPPLARLALGAGHRQARNSHCLASCQLSAVLDQGTGRPGWPRHTFQAQQLVSIDFFTVPTIRFQVLYVFLVLAHDRRRIHQGESADGILAYHTCEITNGRIDNVPLISAPDSHVLSPSFRLRPSSSNRLHAYRTLPIALTPSAVFTKIIYMVVDQGQQAGLPFRRISVAMQSAITEGKR